MKHFFRAGRGMAVGCACILPLIKLIGRYILHNFRFNSVEPFGVLHYGRNDVVSVIFCVLFSGPDLLGTSAMAQSQHRDKSPLVSPAYGQEAKGLDKVQPLMIGSKLPDEFWTQEHLFYVNGDTVRKTLEEYKGKMLVLGFWATWCSSCLQHQKPINNYLKEYSDKLAVIKVNTIRTRDNFFSIKRAITGIVGKHNSLDSNDFSSIIEDSYLLQLFPHGVYPHYVWINKSGQVQTISYRNLLDPNYQAPFVN